MLVGVEPVRVPVADEPEYRLCDTRSHADDHHAGKKLMLDGKRNYSRIEMAKRHPPFLDHKDQRVFSLTEELRIVLRFDEESVAGRRCRLLRA